MKTKRWVIADPAEARVRALSEEGGYAPLTAAVLVARGIDTPEAAADYLSCDTSGLHDPFLLADMDKAVSVVRGAIARGERIVVYGGHAPAHHGRFRHHRRTGDRSRAPAGPPGGHH